MKKAAIFFFFLGSIFTSHGQFAGPPGTAGSTAIYRDSSAFINWASSAQLQLGLTDIANEFSGTASSGDANSALNFPDGLCVSLGDSGVAILTFPQEITNGAGPDFAVFENGFNDQFLELAFVEVSSDGVTFTRFPAISNTQTDIQIGPFDALGDATLLNNLAGKYKANYGTPFDLEALSGTPGLDLSAITHVKIIDVVGAIHGNHSQYDSNGNAINEPYPTPFPQCGFDLDAVGVIHQNPLSIEENLADQLSIFPNPVEANGTIVISTHLEIESIKLISFAGEMMYEGQSSEVSLANCASGIYLVQIQTPQGNCSKKMVVY